jgi:hypothetical protein
MESTAKKIKIVSAIFGIENNIDYIDMPPQCGDLFYYQTRNYNDNNFPLRDKSLHPRLKGKIPKMLDWMYDAIADYYIWIDAPFEIVSQDFIQNTLNAIGDNDMCLCKHNSNRSSIQQELVYVKQEMQSNNTYLTSRYSGEDMDRQVSIYLQDKSFIDNNLFEMGFFIYSKKLVENKNYNLMTDWFFHNCLYSIQDQLSIPYLLHKHNVKYTTFNFNVFNNPDLKYKFT